MFSAFAIADFNNFSITSDDAFGVNFTIAKASSTFFPLIKSATILTFLAEIRAYFKVALASNTAVSSPTIPSLIYIYFVVAFSPA